MKNKIKFCLSAAICLFMPFSAALADEAVNAKAAQFMKAIVGQDIIFDLTTLQKSNNAFFSLPDEPKLKYSVSAIEIARDFKSNPSQAKLKYGNAVFDIIGKIAGVKSDDAGKAYVTFETSNNPSQNAIAYLNEKTTQKAVDYKDGQVLKLRCNGADISTNVILKSCKEMAPAEETATKVADKAVDMFLNGENIETVLVTNGDKPASPTLFFLYYIGTHFELNDNCFSRVTISQCDFTKYNIMQISRSPEYKKAYEDNADFYHLPKEK